MSTDTLKRPSETVEDPSSKKPKNETVEIVEDSRKKGIAYIKPEYIVDITNESVDDRDRVQVKTVNGQPGQKKRGQNKNRDNRQTYETNRLCSTLIDPDSTKVCPFGDNCRFLHNVEEYLKGKEPDLEGVCPVFNALGYCPSGFKCRYLHSHLTDDNKLVKDEEKFEKIKLINFEINNVSKEDKFELVKKRFEFKLSDEVVKIIEDKSNETKESLNEFIDSKIFASEKKKLDLVGKKIVSPLTTVGNLPYRRLMRTLGADVTYSEMALTLPLIQGTNSEWALPKAHNTEYPGFGVQIATSKHWQAAKATEALAKYCPNVSEINLNSGCPIDLLYRQGSGSALLEQPARLIRILNSMNYCSGDIPTTVKLRIGSKDSNPIAHKLVTRLVKETNIAAITLHGRSRQQRYTKEANWDYISQVGSVLRETELEIQEDKERRDAQRINFIGNGDVFNFEDWYKAIEDPNIDSVMIARGALIKPWIFEEIESKQYLDKSATERLEIIKTYSNFALEHWGTDEYGIATARRFICEFLSFFHRYTPYGILERYPIKLNDRPQNWKGRNELETLLGSNDYKDWIKISEMFLGPAGENFNFTPKHKSSSYEKTEY